MQNYQGGDYDEGDSDANRFNNREPRRQNYHGGDHDEDGRGDPYEWLDKADHYFHVYEVLGKKE